jgi:hypothetical protein
VTHLGILAHVGLDEPSLTARVPDESHGLFALAGRPGRNRDGRAFLPEEARNGTSNPSPAAGDDRNLALEHQYSSGVKITAT